MNYKSKSSKACDISQKVKQAVWERDGQRCVLCGSPNAFPNAHFKPRSLLGLGIEENIVTLCLDCHRKYDQTTERNKIKAELREYLTTIYDNWSEELITYTKDGNK